MRVWLNDGLRPLEGARIDPRDRGLLLGDGLFETVCVRAGRLRLWAAHASRLQQGAAALGIAFPDVDLARAVRAVLEADALDDAAVRITLTRGPGPRGIAPPPGEPRPTLLITAAPHATGRAEGVALCLARTTCRNESSPLSRLKTLNYLDGVLARREALARGFDDAVMLNTGGRVAEATVANLFARVGGRWLTPPVEEGALPGVVRGALLAAGFGAESSLSVEQLAQADALVLTNSLGVTEAIAIDGRPLAPGPGAQAQALYDAF